MAVSMGFLNVIVKNSFHGANLPHCFVLMRRLFCDAARPPSTVRNGSETFLNLIVDTSFPCTAFLRRLDLRSHLFSNTAAPSSIFRQGPESAVGQDTATQAQAADAGNLKNKLAEVAAAKMEWIELPNPIFTFETTRVPHCYSTVSFPLTDGKVVLTDHSGCTVLFDADQCLAVTMPKLHKRKEMPISLFVPSADGGNLYILERILMPEAGFCELSDQFEVMVCNPPFESAYCRLLPPPPFVKDRAYQNPWSRITAYAVVGSDICISAERAGTYRLDTCRNKWHKMGNWTLPFNGKVEYVPELKLWFGISAEDSLLAAADLSAMDTQPQLIDIDSPMEVDPPKEWVAAKDSQLVNLGSGRFCITRFFENMLMELNCIAENSEILVLTGVEVILPYDGNSSGSGSEKVKLKLRKHKPRCHMSRSGILAVY